MVMLHRMLARKIKSMNTNSTLFEYGPVMVESLESIVYLCKAFCILHIMSGNIAKFQKSMYSTDHLFRNVAFNRWQIDLVIYNKQIILIKINGKINLHKCFRIISSPLFKSSTFRKSLQSSKRWNCSNA